MLVTILCCQTVSAQIVSREVASRVAIGYLSSFKEEAFEVEGYIQANGHLPEVPSAEEAEADGVDLGEMNRLLLQKVEELTLYVIDLQKQLDELKRRDKNQSDKSKLSK